MYNKYFQILMESSKQALQLCHCNITAIYRYWICNTLDALLSILWTDLRKFKSIGKLKFVRMEIVLNETSQMKIRSKQKPTTKS